MSDVSLHNELMRLSLDAFNQASRRIQNKLEGKIKALPIAEDPLPSSRHNLKARRLGTVTVSPRAKP